MKKPSTFRFTTTASNNPRVSGSKAAGSVLPILLVAMFPGMVANGQTNYCAFEVHVKSPSGQPVEGIGVWLLRRDGTVYSRTNADGGGIARLCDTPPELVDIQIGANLCGAVVVKYLPPYWPETHYVNVWYEHCGGHMIVSTSCRITLRVRDGGGAPLAAAQFAAKPPTPRTQRGISDDLGRIIMEVGLGHLLAGTIQKDGYISADVRQECTSDQTPALDVPVTLRRK